MHVINELFENKINFSSVFITRKFLYLINEITKAKPNLWTLLCRMLSAERK